MENLRKGLVWKFCLLYSRSHINVTISLGLINIKLFSKLYNTTYFRTTLFDLFQLTHLYKQNWQSLKTPVAIRNYYYPQFLPSYSAAASPVA